MASYGSKLIFGKTDLDHFPARVFFDFSRKYDLGFLGQKRIIGDELQVLKTRKMIFGGFPEFSLGQIKKTRHTSMRMIFRVPPTSPNHPNMLRQ